MDEQEQSLIDRIKQAQNVLVTVSVNPSVDQLAAAIGLTIALNKMDKHGTAVFSGQAPSTIEFLKPDETLEKNTDSLRDFIIALDKSKADKLRYKVEDQVVRIFITPYKTSLSEKDLDFSQGDFNVDVVVALGVAEQQDVDAAITAHGRILHDATVASISTAQGNSLGTINWADPSASSLSEMMLSLIDGLDKKLLDNQIATALLTGIVASTDRFRNEKTSPKAMSASAELMAAGANQQLIATELEAPPEPEPEPEPAESHEVEDQEPPKQPEPGELDIDHDDEEKHSEGEDAGASSGPEPPKEPEHPQIHVDEEGMLRSADEMLPPPPEPPKITQVHGVQSDGNPGEAGTPEVHHDRVTEPPALGDTSLTANAQPEDYDQPVESLALPPVNPPLLRHNESVLPPDPLQPKLPENPFIPQEPLQPAPANWQPPEPPPAPTVIAPEPVPVPPPPIAPPIAVPAPAPMPDPIMPPAPAAPVANPFAPPPQMSPPVFPDPTPLPSPPVFTSPASADPTPLPPPSPRPDETLADIEKDVNSPHLQPPAAGSDSVDDARSAVEAALKDASVSAGSTEPIAALNAQPLGPDLHPAAPPMPVPMPPTPANTGFSEPTPGNTPADATLDMPLPSNPFGPAQPATSPLTPGSNPPSAFPGTPPPPPGPQGGSPMPPPPVPPPMLPPMQ